LQYVLLLQYLRLRFSYSKGVTMSIFCTDTPRSNAERLADWRNRLKRHTDANQCAYHYLQQIEDYKQEEKDNVNHCDNA